MSRFRALVIAVVVGLVSVVGTATGAHAQSTGSNKATDVGVTPTTIRIAVVADVENPLQPGLFSGSVAGVQAAARYINANGGIAGRKLTVDFLDSHLSDSEAVNAVIKACSQDFALVGTSALFLNNVNDITSCKDINGAATGIPDLPVVTTEIVQQCDPDSFPINPPQIVCSTQTAHPQTWRVNAGRANYFLSKNKSLHGIYMYTADLQSAKSANQVTATGMQKLGVKPDDQITIGATQPQSAYTPAAQSMKNNNSNFAEVELAYSQTVDLRKEAQLQGVTNPSIVWSCTVQCYNPQFLSQGGASVENQFISLGFLPDIEASQNKAVAGFDKYTDPSKRDGFAADAFAAGLLLRDSVNAVVSKSGNNGLTRKNVFAALNNIHAFTADGMLGTTDVAGRIPSNCYMLVQVKNNKYVRVYPSKAGTLDCSRRNLVQFQLDVPG